MTIAPRTPVLAGVGQLKQRCEDPLDALEPLESMARALERAGEDVGAPALVAQADEVRVLQGTWRYSNPGAWLRDRLGAPGARTALAAISGSMAQTLVLDAAVDIAAGRADVVLVTGAEAQHSERRAKALGVEPVRTQLADSAPDRRFDQGGELISRQEFMAGVGQPVMAYTLFENAVCHALGEAPDAHRQRIAELWAGFSRVATTNPNAWLQEPLDAEQILATGASNRLVAWPYTKLMTANMVVDQAAGVIVCSREAALRAGVPEDRLVYVHAGVEGGRARPMTSMNALHEQPAMGIAGRRALELADLEPGHVEHVDLYSCFPSAVQIAANELGLSTDRPLSVTGGLTFGGGPFNSYVLHAISTMADVLRADPGSHGLVSGLGGYLAKLSYGVYSTEPPQHGFRFADTRPDAEALPVVEAAEGAEGLASIESFSVRYARDEQPEYGVVACRLDDGRRAWARTQAPDLLDALVREHPCGHSAKLAADGNFDLA